MLYPSEEISPGHDIASLNCEAALGPEVDEAAPMPLMRKKLKSQLKNLRN